MVSLFSCQLLIDNYIPQFLITLLGAYIAFRFALWNEREKKEEFYKDTLKYFIDLSNNAISTFNKQVDKLEEHAETLLKNSYENNIVEKYASSDVERLASFSFADLFHAFTYIFPKSDEAVKQYSQLMKNIDMVYGIYKIEMEATEKHVNNVHQRHIKIQELLNDFFVKNFETLKEIESQNSNFSQLPYYIFLKSYIDKQTDMSTKQKPISDYLTEIVTPFLTDIQKNYITEKNAQQLFNLVFQAQLNYNHIRINAENNANKFKEVRKNTQNNVDGLSKLSNILEKKLNN